MNIESYIKIYDDTIPLENISTIIKWSKNQIYGDGSIGEDNTVDKDFRRVKVLPLFDWRCKQKTKIHWANYLTALLRESIQKYCNEISPNQDIKPHEITDISILKYEKGGFYKKHIDHFRSAPRTLSCILLLNNDYEGGEVTFFELANEHIIKTVDVRPGRLIIWPSNFLYPHQIQPIKKGTRYSIVSWAL